MTIAYTTGQITLTNGSAVVTGVGTAWQVSLIAGGFIAAEADGNPLPIATVDSDTSITAAIEWKGASGTYDYALVRDTAYLQQLNVNSNTLARLIAELDAGTIFKYDASGDLAGRATYDARAKGFSYLVFIGVSVPVLYVKASATSGDWSGPFAYGTGPQGIPGPAGYVNPRGTYSAATAYARNDGVLYNGSSFVALQATTGNAPPTLPTTSNAYWQLTAIKGTDGTGTGDVVGPAGAVDGNVPRFDTTTGKKLKGGFAVTAFAETLLDDADAATARATLGIGGALLDAGDLAGLTGKTILLPTNYASFDLVITGMNTSDGTIFWAQTSVDGGASFAAAAADYVSQWSIMAGTVASVVAANEAAIRLIDTSLNNQNRVMIVSKIDPGSATMPPSFLSTSSWTNTAGAKRRGDYASHRASLARINALRIFPPSGTIVTGTYRLYGNR